MPLTSSTHKSSCTIKITLITNFRPKSSNLSMKSYVEALFHFIIKFAKNCLSVHALIFYINLDFIGRWRWKEEYVSPAHLLLLLYIASI